MAPLGAADARPAKRGRTAAPSRARSPAAIECLPDELLGRVFTALGRKAGVSPAAAAAAPGLGSPYGEQAMQGLPLP